MSSRLFLELRERRGLVYEVYSYVNHFLDCGAAITYAGMEPQHIGATVELILEELQRLKEGVPEAELRKAKELVKGRLLLRMEDSRNISSWLGLQELLLNKIYTLDEVMSIVDAITSEDLKRVAISLFHSNKLCLAVVAPLRSERGLQQLLKL
jgi:predicted Zn-dependent peptidase